MCVTRLHNIWECLLDLKSCSHSRIIWKLTWNRATEFCLYCHNISPRLPVQIRLFSHFFFSPLFGWLVSTRFLAWLFPASYMKEFGVGIICESVLLNQRLHLIYYATETTEIIRRWCTMTVNIILNQYLRIKNCESYGIVSVCAHKQAKIG